MLVRPESNARPPTAQPTELPVKITLGTLRSPTATSTKTSAQNINLLYHKSFVIIPSWSRHILLARYPENELVREIFKVKKENERFSVACSRCHQNLKFGGCTSSLCRGSKKYLLKSVWHVQHHYLWSFNQWYHCFVALLSPSSSLKLPIVDSCHWTALVTLIITFNKDRSVWHWKSWEQLLTSYFTSCSSLAAFRQKNVVAQLTFLHNWRWKPLGICTVNSYSEIIKLRQSWITFYSGI